MWGRMWRGGDGHLGRTWTGREGGRGVGTTDETVRVRQDQSSLRTPRYERQVGQGYRHARRRGATVGANIGTVVLDLPSSRGRHGAFQPSTSITARTIYLRLCGTNHCIFPHWSQAIASYVRSSSLPGSRTRRVFSPSDLYSPRPQNRHFEPSRPG